MHWYWHFWLTHLEEGTPPSGHAGGLRPAGQSQSPTHTPAWVQRSISMSHIGQASRQYIVPDGPQEEVEPAWPVQDMPSPGRQAPLCSTAVWAQAASQGLE